MTPSVATDRYLDSRGSCAPQVTDELSQRLLAWRRAIESRPMPEWVTA